MSTFATIAIALTLVAGPAVVIHEDEPGWDCATMGNMSCEPLPELVEPEPAPIPEPVVDPADAAPSGVPGFTYGELLKDAWESYGIADEGEWVMTEEYTMVPNWAASYLGVEVPKYPADHFTIQSDVTPGLVHVFKMTATKRV